MKELKFRVWDKTNKKWFDDYTEFLTEDWFKDGEITQFTGLHDKNSKEIYEGDILESPGWDWKLIFWSEEYSGWCFSTSNAGAIKFTKDEAATSWIIGNIYENPELME